MSHDPSRKSFLARVLGLAAAGAIAPGAVAKAVVPGNVNKADGRSAAFQLRPQPLAVARREGTA